MKYIAYKTAQNSPNLPNGFITDHFATDQESVEGYNVVTLEAFNLIFQNNINLMRQFEESKKVVTVHPVSPAPVLRSASEAEVVPGDFVTPQTNT